MRILLITEQTVLRARRRLANGKIFINAWLDAMKYADLKEPIEIVRAYNGNLLNSKRVVFDLGGNGRNALRIICTFYFGRKKVRLFVNWIGTHEQYNDLTNDDKLSVWDY